MATDVLILNTAACDLRHEAFDFVDGLVGAGGLAKCRTEDMPDYPQSQMKRWIDDGFATAGGPGNTAPLIARTGLKVAVGVNLGAGDYGGLDAQGRFFHDTMAANGIDMSATFVHPKLPTGTTFIHSTTGEHDRGGIAYFPNANNDFDFEVFKRAVERMTPRIVYYMYSGLSDQDDAQGRRDLAAFIKWCRDKGSLTVVDSHTLTGNPGELIDAGAGVEAYHLLEPLLPEADVFFTSCDEAKLIENTLAPGRVWRDYEANENVAHGLHFLTRRFWRSDGRTRLFGVTVSDGAFERHLCPDSHADGPNKVESKFMAGEVVDLVGAGDSFRAGLITYLAVHLDDFRKGSINFAEAVQMGNLFASLYIKAPLGDRYGNIKPYETMLRIVRGGATYSTFEALQAALG